jgi:hypothetical protein
VRHHQVVMYTFTSVENQWILIFNISEIFFLYGCMACIQWIHFQTDFLAFCLRYKRNYVSLRFATRFMTELLFYCLKKTSDLGQTR